MKIKMYTKVICYPLEGMPYEKIMWVAYDSIDDINIIDGEDVSKVAIVEDAKVSYHFGDTDGNMPLRKPMIYPCLAQDPILFAKKMLGDKWSEAVDKYSSMIAKAVSRKLTLSDLHIMYMNEPIDGISANEELILRGVFGIHEKKWRAQREFFEFACRPRYNVERSALVSAAHAVVEAMRLAGEDEETVRRYKRNFIAPALRKHR